MTALLPTISSDIKAEIRARTDIFKLVGEYVRLVPSGRTYKGLCPFHQEKTPSFYVIPHKQMFHCFGCGKGGDAFAFVMEAERLTFPEAVRLLARRIGIELPERAVTLKQMQQIAPLVSLWNDLFHKPPTITAAAVHAVDHWRNVSHARATRDFGYQPRPFEQSVIDTYRWIVDNELTEA